jgi:hypothetical protein
VIHEFFGKGFVIAHGTVNKYNYTVLTAWISAGDWLVQAIQVHTRMPACYINGVALQPSCGAGGHAHTQRSITAFCPA